MIADSWVCVCVCKSMGSNYELTFSYSTRELPEETRQVLIKMAFWVTLIYIIYASRIEFDRERKTKRPCSGVACDIKKETVMGIDGVYFHFLCFYRERTKQNFPRRGCTKSAASSDWKSNWQWNKPRSTFCVVFPIDNRAHKKRSAKNEKLSISRGITIDLVSKYVPWVIRKVIWELSWWKAEAKKHSLRSSEGIVTEDLKFWLKNFEGSVVDHCKLKMPQSQQLNVKFFRYDPLKAAWLKEESPRCNLFVAEQGRSARHRSSHRQLS